LLTRLIYKDKLEWGPKAQKAFQDLKATFTTAPILVHPDFSKPFYIETDASNFAFGAVLSQEGDERRLHPVAFYPRNCFAAEINYEIHDKELLAIVDFFQEWSHFLEGASHLVTIYTDHKNLEYFITARILNRRQARWNMSLSLFDIVITYRPIKQQSLSDVLSRRSYPTPKEREVAYEQQQTTLLKAEQLRLRAATMSTPVDSSFLDQVCVASTMDPLVLNIKCRSDNNCEKFKFVDDLLYFEERLYIPEGPARLRVLQAYHDFPATRHDYYSST
jgi:hypothetical protein